MPGLVPSSPHIPFAAQLPGMLPAPPAWTSAPKTATDSSPASPKKQVPHISGIPRPFAPTTMQLLDGRICPCLPGTAKVTGGRCDTGAGACPPRSRPVCSAPCLWLGCYQSLLGKDSTQDSSQSDFRVCSAPPIKLQAAPAGGQTKLFIAN